MLKNREESQNEIFNKINGNTGAGVLVEVYDNRVVVKGRDFITDRPLAERTYKFDGDNYDWLYIKSRVSK